MLNIAIFNKKKEDASGGFGVKKSVFNFSKKAKTPDAPVVSDVISQNGNVIRLSKPGKKIETPDFQDARFPRAPASAVRSPSPPVSESKKFRDMSGSRPDFTTGRTLESSSASRPPTPTPSARPVIKPERVSAFLKKEQPPRQNGVSEKEYFLSKLPGRSWHPKKLRALAVFGSGVLFLMLAAAVLFMMADAQIVIHTRVTTISVSPLTITVDPKAQTPNFNSKRLPGMYVEAKASTPPDRVFEAKTVGYTESKARGFITVYNEYSTSPQVLIGTTRFESKSTGLIFRIPERVTVPGATKEGGNLVPGSIRVEVLADEIGEKYNIGPDDFVIPAFRGSPRYQGFYAKSVEPFQGGLKGAGAIVTADEIRKAEEAVTAEVFEEAKKELQSKVPPGFVMLPGARSVTVTDIEKPRPGEAVQSFRVSADAVASAILYKEDDFYLLISRLFVEEGANETVLRQKSDLVPTNADYDVDNRLLTFTLSGNVVLVPTIDQETLKSEIVGKSKKNAEEILRSKPEITDFTLDVFPPLLNRIPSDTEKIGLRVEL